MPINTNVLFQGTPNDAVGAYRRGVETRQRNELFELKKQEFADQKTAQAEVKEAERLKFILDSAPAGPARAAAARNLAGHLGADIGEGVEDEHIVTTVKAAANAAEKCMLAGGPQCKERLEQTLSVMNAELLRPGSGYSGDAPHLVAARGALTGPGSRQLESINQRIAAAEKLEAQRGSAGIQTDALQDRAANTRAAETPDLEASKTALGAALESGAIDVGSPLGKAAQAIMGLPAGDIHGELLDTFRGSVPTQQITGTPAEFTTKQDADTENKAFEVEQQSARLSDTLAAFDARYLQLGGRFDAAVTNKLDQIGISTKADRRKFAAQRAAFLSEAERTFLKIRKSITGVAGGEQEAKDIRLANPSGADTPLDFLAKSIQLIATNENVQAEIARFRAANGRPPTSQEGRALVEQANITVREEAPLRLRVLAPELMGIDELQEIMGQGDEYFDSLPGTLRVRIVSSLEELQ